MSTDPITAEEARQLFHYNPETGELTWKVSLSTRAPVGHIVRSKDGAGYYRVGVRGKKYKAHRIAWLMTYGQWPKGQIDHINGIRMDNRLCNLREASNAENQRNRAAQRNNTSGFKGVYWDKSRSKWLAKIDVGGERHHLGRYKTPEEAHAAYCKAAEEFHGEFAKTA